MSGVPSPLGPVEPMPTAAARTRAQNHQAWSRRSPCCRARPGTGRGQRPGPVARYVVDGPGSGRCLLNAPEPGPGNKYLPKRPSIMQGSKSRKSLTRSFGSQSIFGPAPRSCRIVGRSGAGLGSGVPDHVVTRRRSALDLRSGGRRLVRRGAGPSHGRSPDSCELASPRQACLHGGNTPGDRVLGGERTHGLLPVLVDLADDIVPLAGNPISQRTQEAPAATDLVDSSQTRADTGIQ